MTENFPHVGPFVSLISFISQITEHGPNGLERSAAVHLLPVVLRICVDLVLSLTAVSSRFVWRSGPGGAPEEQRA